MRSNYAILAFQILASQWQACFVQAVPSPSVDTSKRFACPTGILLDGHCVLLAQFSQMTLANVTIRIF
jgi:hypothetical protein